VRGPMVTWGSVLRLSSAIQVVCVMVCLSWFATGERLLAAEEGGSRRALLVGIDRYVPTDFPGGESAGRSIGRRWKDLKGAVNDVHALREVLIHRFGFRSRDVLVLENQAATRQAILAAFEQHLIAPARPGDHSFFFYAGHGSRIRNSRSTELDGKDETVVPADGNAQAGNDVIIDIRDKEWDRLFTQVLDHGAWLTALFDSCHSGSISRGAVPLAASTRFLDEDERDIATILPPDAPAHPPGMEPEKREGALIISAAQEDQQAKEMLYVAGQSREWHGAFSLALIQSLNELSPHVTVDRLFERVTARLVAEGYQQEPTLAGTLSRRHAPLLGGSVDSGATQLRMNLIQAYAADDLELQGGIAVGVTPGTELVRVSAAPEVRIRVTEVRSLARSRARVVKGNWHDLRAGEEFEVVHRATQHPSTMSVWVPPAVADYRQVNELARQLAALAPHRGVTMIDDPTTSDATHMLIWRGDQWLLWSNSDHPRALGATPKAIDVLHYMTSEQGRATAFLNIPPTRDLAKTLDAHHLLSIGVAAASKPDEAVYALAGRLVGSQVEYAWIQTRLSGTAAIRSARQIVPLPERTVWSRTPLVEGACEAGGIRNCLARLAKVYYWLTIAAASGEDRFPYRLGFKGLADDRIIERGDLIEGRYRLILRAEPEAIGRIGQGLGLQSRYVYVFVIDQEGRITQLFPNAGSREREHLLPRPESLRRPATELAELPFGESGVISVHAPFGTDTYLMITSAQAIPHLDELLEAGPVSAEPSVMRGASDWSIDRLFLRSLPASR